MTTLATTPLEPDLLSELALVADPYTQTRKPFADKFRLACELEAGVADDFGDRGPLGFINPNRVRLLLLDDPTYNPRQFSALWSSTWLAKTTLPVQIAGPGSRGNTNKQTVYRRLAVAS